MGIEWLFLIKSAWPIFWVTTVYSYLVCAIVGTTTGIKTQGNKERINKAIEGFIASPLYTSTFFCLLSTLFFWKGVSLLHHIHNRTFLHMLIMGGIVFIGHSAIEVLESTFIWKNPLRILEDKDALRLSGVYLIVLVQTAVLALFLI
jgi:hypothetical protein